MSFFQKLFPKEEFHQETKAGDRVPFVQKLAIGMGEIPGVGHKSIEILALPVFNLALGVNPVLITAVLALTRFWDAFTDPLAGSLSDNTNSRFGRRRPYLFVSSVVCGISLALVFMMPATWSSTAMFIYFLIIALIFYTSYSFFNIPLMAIAWEISPDYHERTRVIAYKIFFSRINHLMSEWLLALSALAIFGGVLQGARVATCVVAVVMIVFGLIPAYLVKEGNLKIALKEKRMKFVESVRKTLKNKPFLIFCMIATARDLPQVMISTLGLYVSIFFVFEGDIKGAAVLMGISGTIATFFTMGLVPVITRLITTKSKRQMLGISIFSLMIVVALKWVCYHPDWPWMIVVHSVLLVPPTATMSMVMNSMMADICDYDEFMTGSRREGIYASIYSWIGKAVGSLSIFVSGVILWGGGIRSKPARTIRCHPLRYSPHFRSGPGRRARRVVVFCQDLPHYGGAFL